MSSLSGIVTIPERHSHFPNVFTIHVRHGGRYMAIVYNLDLNWPLLLTGPNNR